jgi:hypothetical protein
VKVEWSRIDYCGEHDDRGPEGCDKLTDDDSP